MVALNDNFTKKPEAGVRKQQSEKLADRFIPANRRSPRSSDPSVVQHQFLFVDRGPLAMERSVDAMNRRVRKTIFDGGLTGNIPNGTTDYVCMGNQVMEERSSSNAPIRQYVWGTYIDELIQLTTLTTLGSQNLSPGTYYLSQDLLYRAVALTNSSGAIVEAYDTDAYGNTLIFTAPDSRSNWWSDSAVQSNYGANEIIYCGHRYDPETQLYYVRNRTYSPILGRWLQRDPIGYRSGPSLYQYVGSNSPVAADPQGLRHIPFVFDSFINGQLRGQWLPQPSIGPVEAGWQFEANTREFGQFSPGNSKLFSEGWIESMDIGHTKGKVGAYWGASDVGVSTRRKLVNGSYVYQTEKATVIGGQPRVTDGFTGGAVRCDTAIRFTASAGYPFVWVSPPIVYNIVFDFAVVAHNKVTVIINGFTTQLPDFEAYIDGGLVYQHESPFAGPGFNDLGPNNETNFVNVTKTFSAPTPCKCSKKNG